jgi:hypothetical protein
LHRSPVSKNNGEKERQIVTEFQIKLIEALQDIAAALRGEERNVELEELLNRTLKSRKKGKA